MTILQEALDLVDGERQEDYGPPHKMAARVSALFFDMTGIDLSPGQCIQFMMAMKLARLRETPDHRDSLVDLAGYIDVYDRVTSRDEHKEYDYQMLGDRLEGPLAIFKQAKEDIAKAFVGAEHPDGMTPTERHAQSVTGDPHYYKPEMDDGSR